MKRFKRKAKINTYQLSDIFKQHGEIKLVTHKEDAIELVHNSVIILLYENYIKFYNNMLFKNEYVQHKYNDSHLYYYIENIMTTFTFNEIPIYHIKQSHNYFLFRLLTDDCKYYINMKKIDNIHYNKGMCIVYRGNSKLEIKDSSINELFFEAIKTWLNNYKKKKVMWYESF